MTRTRVMPMLSEVVLQPNGWPAFVEAFCSHAGVRHFVIAERDSAGHLLLDDAPWEHELTRGYDGEAGLAAYREYYQAHDIPNLLQNPKILV